MTGRWAFNWVQIMGHHYSSLMTLFTFISLGILAGLFNNFSILDTQSSIYIGTSLLIMSLWAMKIMDSIKAGGLLFLLSAYALLMLAGIMSWLEISFDEHSVLGWVVIIAMMMSNLVHVLSTLLREMARGSFQHDALAEALKQNATPILLSNITTCFGFVVAAFYDASFYAMAWIVVLGAIISYLTLLSWLPIILLKFFLEFRVGHYDDRHGLVDLVSRIQQYPRAVKLGVSISIIVSLISLGYLAQFMTQLYSVGVMLLASFFLLLIIWQDLKITFITLVSSFLSVVIVLAAYFSFQGVLSISAFVLIVPLGMVLDDAIHYFSRYLKSKRGFFNDDASCHRFALSTVGRPIWLTTQLLMIGLLILSFHPNTLIQQASFITIFTVFLASYIILVLLPVIRLRRS
ncbi:hypothetical protein GHNINEIG_01240 [Hydrogenovibrio crunogenus]|uniref:Uncharacterized protein n=1 Tax=Hydrogenovibrio crunogenus TaxID=39765 RepID=A0A4P7NZT5_9GAMM|nr:hypothetical protein [Hydrogenovibrio crunogenus]QBZ83196.1 hypothetical protein GHNINEIG_01240 [Hydrogenovibrio crunogenus]